MNILEVEEITSGYGSMDVLFGVSAEIEEEGLVAIIGPNGAGKSTLLKAVVGAVQAKKGRITFKDQEITNWPIEKIVKSGLSWVPQDDHIFPTLSVAENLDVGAYSYQGNYESRVERVWSFFPQLKDRMDQTAGDLSGGQQQMVAVGRGLMSEPDLLLLDEPTAGLAPNLIQMMYKKIEEINESGVTVLLVAQSLETFRASKRGYLLSSGEIKYSGTTGELLGNEEVQDLYFGG
ncbi:ABC transporter ATP-binding protein [Candidatus Bipolaricaulota bacterium]|nr:ABC transporter ATP-binding protein [Candidatus Bipolaricaulota bacterium]